MESTNYIYEYSKEESIVLFENNRTDEKIDLSIVIPTYKRLSLLKETILSIINQKRPKHLKYEVVVVSNDINFQVKDLGLFFGNIKLIVYANKNNIGMCGNMNRCVSLSSGKYIAYLQDDDILLNNYLCSIEKLIDNGTMNDIGCLIPNRYFYFDENDKVSAFGEKTKKKEVLKYYLNKIVRIGCRDCLLQQVSAIDCYRLSYNCFAGGPTCGMLFDKELLMSSDGFNPDYPYSFDYIFLLNYSENNKVLLYNKYLAVYRMSESASNKPQVQYDFFRGEIFLINKMKKLSVKHIDENILIKFAFNTKSKEARKLIAKDYEIKSCSQFKYCLFKIIRYVKLMRSGFYRKKIMPNKYGD